jgi:hypothetical protein
VRYSGEHKQAMRQRMIEAAGRRFKTDGIDGVSASPTGLRRMTTRRYNAACVQVHRG